MTIRRILAIGICCLLVPMIFLPIFTSYAYQKNLEEKTVLASQQNLSQIANQMQHMITSLVATANLLCSDQDVISTLEADKPETQLEKFQQYKSVSDKIAMVSSSTLVPYNAEMYVFGNNGTIYSNQTEPDLELRIRDLCEERSEELKKKGAYILWIAPMLLGTQDVSAGNIAIAKTITDTTTNESVGVAVISLLLDKNLKKLFKTDVTDTTSQILLLNDEKKLIYATDKGAPLSLEAEITDKMTRASGSFTAEISGEKQLIDYRNLERTNWKLVQLSSYEILMEEIIALRYRTIVINASFLSLLFAAGLIFSRKLADPLHEMCLMMKRLPQGDFSVRMKTQKGKSEIAQLERGFNAMVTQMEQLFTELEQSYEVRENLRLEALRAQVNPHFLFNTLNSIKWMATMQGDATVSHMIGALGNLLQYSLASNEEMVPLERELTCIRDYVEIQKMRFGDRFEFRIEIPEALMQVQVPLFIFQPVVENSIIHAFEDDRRGVIEIASECREDGICFMIRDNGKGMDENAWKNPIDGAMKSKGKFSKIGLMNVDERLKMIYGKNYGISVRSTPGAGTVVTLRFPNPAVEGKQ